MSADQHSSRVAEFLKQEGKKLLHYVRRHFDEAGGEDAEDIIQDVMLGIFDRADITAPIENLSAYIYRALYNRIVDRYRRAKQRRTESIDSYRDGEGVHTLSDMLWDERYNAYTELEKKELWKVLFDAVDGLKPRQKAVFVATEFEGRTFRELSSLWGVPLGTLLSQKHRAVKKIRSALETTYDG
jgi:RNA polymerase sigma factor (sigma-70 family)